MIGHIFNVGYLLLLITFSSNLSATSYAPLPNDISELINTSDLIVIGTIGEIVDKRLFYGYQDGAELLTEKHLETPTPLALPLVDFSIAVQEIIMDDEKFPIADNKKPVIFRIFQDHDKVSSTASMEDRKGKMIFFLTRTPDNKAYGITSLMHRIKLENDEVLYSMEGINYKVPFAKNTEDFVNQVKQATLRSRQNVTGLWQNLDNAESYYSFHQNAGTIIMIDLSRLESSGKTFSATYIGSTVTEGEGYRLNPMLPGISINMTFQSDEEAVIIPICDTCSVVMTRLKKVF